MHTKTRKYLKSEGPRTRLKLALDQGFHSVAARLAYALPEDQWAILGTRVQPNASARLPQVARIKRVREALEAAPYAMSPQS